MSKALPSSHSQTLSQQPIQLTFTIAENIQHAKQLLTAASNPQVDAEVLLAEVLRRPRSYLLAHGEQYLTKEQQALWQSFLNRRVAGEPLAYILGYREFWSLILEVSPATLVPRPETELLVELTLATLPTDTPQTIADLGTGTGAIALALAHECKHWQVYAVDQSPAALQIAMANAKRLGLNNIDFRQSDWCLALPNHHYHAIISNPPYIASNDQHLRQGEVRFEPITALVAGTDGLEAIRMIIQQARQHLLTRGWLLLEHGYDQARAVTELFTAAGYTNIKSHSDLAGIARVTMAQIPVE